MPKKPKFQGVGRCPNCGKENLTYGGTEIEGESLGYEYTCDDCDTHGIEWYDLTYSETTIL